MVVQVKALACELPYRQGFPLSHWTTQELATQAQRQGLVASISESTVWRWLDQDAIRPWQHRSWIFPRDPQFALKAGRILDLYHRTWEGCSLKKDEFVVCADEKTSIQARKRIHPTLPPQPGRPMKLEHEYERQGSLAYLAALDVHRMKLFGHCSSHSGIEPFDRLVDQLMRQAPYRHARRVFWIVDNGSSHRGPTSVNRIQKRHRQLVLVHGPIHASWLNQIEIYFSVVQRKVLTPNDVDSLEQLERRIMDFERYYESIAKPFEWKFTRDDLTKLLRKISEHQQPTVRIAA